jgi:hypothetical protein
MNRNYTYTLSQNDPFLQKTLYQQSISQKGTTTLPQKQAHSHEVLLLIGGLIERIMITPGLEYQLGRFDNADNYQVNLAIYGAIERGISRLHACLFVRDNNLYIVDQGSTNGTFVSGERLEPNQEVMLHKGSEILLGRLRVQIMFR